MDYEISKEISSEVLEFLEAVEELKSTHKNCNLDNHKTWSKIFQLDSNQLKLKLDVCSTNIDQKKSTVIDLTESESDREDRISSISNSAEANSLKECNGSINDVMDVIKENLMTTSSLTKSVILEIQCCSDENLEKLFNLLADVLYSEQVFNLGSCLDVNCPQNNSVMTFYCRNLLIPQLKEENHPNLLLLLNQISIHHPKVLENELLSVLSSERKSKVFLHCINGLSAKYQSKLLREFIFSIGKIQDEHLEVIERLLNSSLEQEALNKLVVLLSNVANDYSNEKDFGKLIMNVIKVLGQNVLHLEQPLKHIITQHKSVWKANLEKSFNNYFEDSLMLSQTFGF